MSESGQPRLDRELLDAIDGQLAPGETASAFVEAAVRTRLSGSTDDPSEETEYLRGLQAVTAALASAQHLSQICQVVLDEAGMHYRGERAIWKLHNGRLLLVAGGELSRRYPEIPLDDSFPARANLESGEPLYVESRQEVLARWPVLKDVPTSAFAGLPLLVEGRRLGLMALGFERDHRFSPGERDFLQSVAEQTAVAIERADLRQARAAAQQRREFLAEAMFEMAAPHASAVELLQHVTELAVPRLADWSVVFVRRGGQYVRVAQSRNSEASSESALAYVQSQPLRELLGSAGITDSLEPGILTLEPTREGAARGTRLLERLQISSLMYVPLNARDGLSGLALFAAGRNRPPYQRADLGLATSFAARANIALENQRLQSESRIFAETLTRAILPGRFPELKNIQFGACFEPAGEGSIGGDWYDVFELPNGSFGIVVGDISGHGVQATAAMARLRNGLFAFMSEGHPPTSALAHLAPLLTAPDSDEEDDLIATVKLGALDPQTCKIEMANAGHPPMLLIRHGEAQFGPGGGTLLSSNFEPHIAEYTLALEPGDLLLLYTDGLVERVGEVYDESLARLATEALALQELADLNELCVRLVEATAPRATRRDDCCLLAVRVRSATAR